MNLSERTQGHADFEHPSIELLNAFAVGQLTEHDSHEVEEHLAACDRCNRLLEASPDDSFVSLLQQGDSLVLTGPSSAVGPSQALRFVPGYALLERLGEGGMGVVWKARQDGLNRLVALKRLRAAGTASRETLARFRREAEAVARLHHANIVQIYEIGEQDGEPYLALEYVGGGNLAQKMANGPLPPQRAAVLVETLARAMQHAHEQGIIHRDLKPSNVLLANDGSPKISDFGLAKQLDEATAHTQTGAILGTPSYMAPEQAESGQTAIGPAVDVYALGAILYETLTGRPPFRGPTVLDTLAQVREREPVPPRQLQPSVLRDLETICLKCLHKEPWKRYSSAAELAEDLRRFREGQPIRARRANLLERVAKWIRRRPALATLAIVSTLALAALLGGSLWYQARLQAAVKRADANRDRADANYRQARQAINQMLDRLAKFQAPGVPQIEILRRDLSKDALAFFQSIAETEAEADPATRFDFAKAYVQLGRFLGNHDLTAGASLDHARLLLERLCAEDAENVSYRFELAQCLEGLAICEASQGRPQECLHLREQNLEVCRELNRLAPDSANCLGALAVAHLNLGGCWTAHPERAEFHWKEAVRILEKLVLAHPEKPDEQYRLAISASNLAMLYRDTGRISEADAAYREVEPRLTKLVQENASRKEWTLGLVQTLRNWGGMLVKARRGEEAYPLLNRAVAIMDKYYLEDPQTRAIQELLLGCLVARMCCNTLLHRRDEGEKDWQRSVALSAQLNSWRDLCIGVMVDAQLGDHALAAARVEYLVKQKGLDDEDLYRVACASALAASAAQNDIQLASADRERKADRYAAKAIALLNKLRGLGYFEKADKLDDLRTDKDLDSLRHRDHFVKLLKELTNKPPASGK